jgi:hypothetical protein
MSKASELLEVIDSPRDESESYVLVGKAEELLIVMDEKITTQLLGDLEAVGKGHIDTEGTRRDISTRSKAISVLRSMRPETDKGQFNDTSINLLQGMSDQEYATLYKVYVMNNTDPAPKLVPPVTAKTPNDLLGLAPDQATGDAGHEYEVEIPTTPIPPEWIGNSGGTE